MKRAGNALLVQQLKKGNQTAFRKLYDRYHQRLFLLARKYLKDPGIAEDAVQDIFLKVWEKREELDPESSIEGFLHTILRNHVLNMIRDHKKEILLGYTPVDLHVQNRNSTREDILYREYENIVLQGLKKLSKRRREVFIHRRFQGLTNAEVAKKFAVSINTVKCQLYHGTKFLKNYLKEHANI